MAIYRRFLFRSEVIFPADMKRCQLSISAFFSTKRYVLHTYVRDLPCCMVLNMPKAAFVVIVVLF